MGWRDWFGGRDATSTDDLAREAAAVRATTPGGQAPQDAAAQIEALVHAGEKIEAIKIYRQEYGGSLVEAKDAIDAIARGEASPALGQGSHPASDSDVEELAAQGKWIDAIKLYREKHDVGLEEAKAAVDAMPRGH